MSLVCRVQFLYLYLRIPLDAAFRRVISKYGKPHVLTTEFVSAAGLVREDARKRLMIDLLYDPIERPIQVQLFGSDPNEMYKACEYVRSLGFDGIDINMGCPDKSVCNQGSGAALIENPTKAQEVIRAAQKALLGSDIPLSVKTRIGYNRETIDEWLPFLLETGIDALTLHLRTKKEMSLVPAKWDDRTIGKAVDIVKRKYASNNTLIIGNGDVVSVSEAREKAELWNLDGVMIGRGIFGNPWLFSDTIPTPEDRILVLKEHVQLYDELLFQPGHKPLALMKKHFKSYLSGLPDAKNNRVKLMDANHPSEVYNILDDYLHQIKGTNITL